MNRSMDLTSWLLLFTVGFLWSTSFLFIEIALEELDVLAIVFTRVAIAASALWAFAFATGHIIPSSLKLWSAFAGLALVSNVVPFSLVTWGQIQILSGEAAILSATTPLFTVILGHFFTRDDRITWNRVAGLMIGITGIAILIGFEVTDAGKGAGAGYLAVLVAAFIYGVGVHLARRLSAGVSGVVAATCTATASALWLLPAVIFTDVPIPSPAELRASTVLAILGLGLPCAALSYILFFALVRRAGATNTMLMTLVFPGVTMILGLVFLNERFGFNDLAGLVLILAALLFIDGRLLRFSRRRLRTESGRTGH